MGEKLEIIKREVVKQQKTINIRKYIKRDITINPENYSKQ
jgi:hypothetical protein